MNQESSRASVRGFSLIELLLVLAIIAILSAVAIPSFLGQRQRARRIGDAMANARILQIQLATRHAEATNYGADGTYTWNPDGTGSGPAFLSSFVANKNTKMTYVLEVKNTGQSWTLTVNDQPGGVGKIFQTDQTGAQLYP